MSEQAIEQQPTAQPHPPPPSDPYARRLDDVERVRWRETGALPERLAGDHSRENGELEKIQQHSTSHNPLEDLTHEERQKWRETGELPKSAKVEEARPETRQQDERESPVPRATWETSKQGEITQSPQTPEQVRIQHEKNWGSLVQASQSNVELGAALNAINLDSDRGGVLLHALSDLPADLQVTVAKELASRPDVQAAMGQFTREQVAQAAQDIASHFVMQRQEQAITYNFQQQVVEARKKYPDFDQVALEKTLPIRLGGLVDRFIATEEHGTDVLYYLGKNRHVLNEILKLNPLQQHRKLIEIEGRVASASEPPRSSAPKPPSEVGGRGTGWDDDGGSAAVRRNDYRAAKAAWNATAIKKAKL